MRIPVSLALAAATLTWAGAARAQAPLNPYEAAEPAPADAPAIAPAPAPIQPVAPAVPPAPPVPPPPPATVIDPYGQYPAPPAYGYQPPSAGPAETAGPPSYQRGYYLYSAPGQPPVYYAPPPAAFRCNAGYSCSCMQACCGHRLVLRAKKKWDGVRRIALGAHAGFLTLNQMVGKDQVTLGGAGFQLRFRGAGHFGFEIQQSFLHADYWDGAWSRDSFPFQLSMMLYLFPNKDAHHFNLYGVGGAGLVGDSVSLYDERRIQVTQSFTEFELHAGVGAELRFKWFGIEADARYLWLWRGDSDDGRFYGDLAGAPVQKSSQGVQGNVYLSIWF